MKKPASHAISDPLMSEELNNEITEIYDRHVDMVYRVCYSIIGNKQEAEDAVQSVFIKFLENKKSFNDIEHEKAWLIVTARNHCYDTLRKWWRKKVVDIDLSTVGGEDSDSFKYTDLEENIRKLPKSQRLILYLHYYEGYKLVEISNMLEINLNTVKTRVRNARKQLKLEIGDD